MLTFGGSSSAGIYDDLAKLICDLATISSDTDKRLVNQVLDDVVAVGADGDGTVNRFYDAYRHVSNTLGVSLADETDRDKAFRASHQGKVLGISYDLGRWVWTICEDKLILLLRMLHKVKTSDVIENTLAMSLNGKLNHYMWLVPDGAWQRGFLLRLQNSAKHPGYKVTVLGIAKDLATWG